MAANDKRFAAVSLTLKHDGIKLLVMFRLCPLPYSLSNGAVSTIPTVQWQQFMLATALATPKLILHIFIGSRLGAIADHGATMDAKTRAVSYASIAIGTLAGAATGWFMFTRTQARAREIEEEERQRLTGGRGGRRSRRRGSGGSGSGEDGYDDTGSDGDGDDYQDSDDAAERGAAEAIRGNDGISLHSAADDDDDHDARYTEGPRTRYRDEEEGLDDLDALDHLDELEDDGKVPGSRAAQE